MRVGEHRLITLLALSLLWLGCNPTSTPPAEDAAASETPTTPAPLSPPITSECRPVDHVWDPATEPMLLPCEPTTEPCDNIDNDDDGFTDPHCPTRTCTSDSDCTYNGLLPDADCNFHPTIHEGHEPYPPGVCNQIDALPIKADHDLCWGKLCPPALKCVLGECIPPGTGLPNTDCTSGADCPLNAGCIPAEFETGEGDVTTGRCVWFCHEFSCTPDTVCFYRENLNEDTGVMHSSEQCCTPICAGKDCGTDGCGGTCGDCAAEESCNDNGVCAPECTPHCRGKTCGSDQCGGTCGSCDDASACNLETGNCESCPPQCEGMVCGPDACGGSCGTCEPGIPCNNDTGQCSRCTPDCSNKPCGGSNGCGGPCPITCKGTCDPITGECGD